MVKLCYVLSALTINAISVDSMSTEYAKVNGFKQNILTSPNQYPPVVRSQYPPMVPYLSKRDTRHFKDTKKGAFTDDDINNEDYEPAVNSYSFRKLQKKMGTNGKKFNMPVSGPVPDWDDQYYDNDGKPIVYQVDTEELKEMIDSYIDMGKEKWAGFLATSECNKFQKLMDKLKKMMGKDEEDDCDDEEIEKKPKAIHTPDDDCEDKINHSTQPISSNKKTSTRTKQNKSYDFQNPKALPVFSNVDEEEIQDFQDMLAEVIKYWEKEDARDIMKAAKGISYKDFSLEDEEDYSEKLTNSKTRKTKSGNKNKKVSASGFLDEDDEIDEDEEYEIDGGEDVLKPVSKDLLERMDPSFIKTKSQKEWLKSNAVRRAKMLQALLNGELDTEGDSKIIQQDEVRYRDGDIFLTEDDNEFMSNGFKLQSANLAIYIFFLAEVVLFYVF